jgi:hypothetical protein
MKPRGLYNLHGSSAERPVDTSLALGLVKVGTQRIRTEDTSIFSGITSTHYTRSTCWPQLKDRLQGLCRQYLGFTRLSSNGADTRRSWPLHGRLWHQRGDVMYRRPL